MTAREGAPFGIRCHVIAPGAVETKMLRSIAPPSVLPPEQTLPPSAVGKVIAQVIAGDLAPTSGEVIYVHQ
jgi:NAD(P)-dependent dehydrogenase (short-subunit alcohol dehydrogenase family)